MKYLLLILVLIPVSLYSQSKNKIYYEGGVLTDELIQNYLSEKQKVIHNKVLGIDVKVIVDTIFKKYTIAFTDKDEKKMAMVFNYKHDYFLDSKEENPKLSKLYRMEFMGLHFFLIDYLDTSPFYELEIRHEEMLPNQSTLLYRIKNAKRLLSR